MSRHEQIILGMRVLLFFIRSTVALLNRGGHSDLASDGVMLANELEGELRRLK